MIHIRNLLGRFLPPKEADPLPPSYQQIALGLSDWPRMSSVEYRNQVVKTSREGSDPEIVRFYQSFQSDLAKRGIPMFAFEFYRSPERQARLKAQGVSKAGPNQSPHNVGRAVDIVHSQHFWELDRRQWEIIGLIGKESARKASIPVVWGGDWSFYDPAHWELRHWRQ